MIVEMLVGAKCAACHLHEEEEIAIDDQSGAVVEPRLTHDARQAEIAYFKSMNVYTKAPIAECWRETGRAPISIRWVDNNKGDAICPNYRSRLVAR